VTPRSVASTAPASRSNGGWMRDRDQGLTATPAGGRTHLILLADEAAHVGQERQLQAVLLHELGVVLVLTVTQPPTRE
jgi:hypothetical protein